MRAKTGFVIGGVAPVGHLEQIVTFVDEDLFRYGTVWAAARLIAVCNRTNGLKII
ncbi:hypothetical protein MNQ98_22325 [Paenibacillus sp. N3/727]|uniref:hypothetical protein n=1 Tax=Paenibacillus sp. N3/727 TaxID=2925845 RepID=UPI001F52D0D8|nr:hypothetical protein [Paenibacillus sp. N3/727]UNK17192.1 hypothetical protein MNQ98_22325 [Paenibacillus sp. N3/727]